MFDYDLNGPFDHNQFKLVALFLVGMVVWGIFTVIVNSLIR